MKKDRKKICQKALILFFVVVAVCTVVSRAADAMTIPKVTVQQAEEGRITYTLKGDGAIEAAAKSTYLMPGGFLVESCMENGTGVEAGDVLIQFQREQLEKRRAELETALEQAKLQLEQAKLGQKEDAWIPAEEEAQKALNQAQAEYDQAAAQKQQIQEKYNQNVLALLPEAEDYEARKAELDAAFQEETAEVQGRLDAAATGLTSAQQALEAAKKSDDMTRQNNAKAQQAAGYTVESAQLEVDKAEENLREAEELIAQEGKIYAAEKGIFLNTAVTEGTVTTGSEFVSIGTGNLVFTAEVAKEAREKLAEGDTITIKVPGQEEIKTAITQITSGKKQEEGTQKENTQEETVSIKAVLPEGTELSGEYASFSVEKDSEENYQTILPLTAIRQDSKGYYCLGIRTVDTILGEEIKAERINITLLEQDDTQAAVNGAIQPDTKIIVASEKDVLAGDRVRIKE